MMKDLDNPTVWTRLIYSVTGALAGILMGWGIVLCYTHFVAPFPNGLLRFAFFIVLVISLTILSGAYPKRMRWLLAPFMLWMHFLP